MEINWPTILTIGSIIGTILLVFKTLKSDIAKISDKLSAFEKSTEHRLTSLEAEVKNVNQRIDSTNQRIDGTNQRLTDLRTDINQRLSTIEGYLVPKKIYRIEEPLKDESKEN